MRNFKREAILAMALMVLLGVSSLTPINPAQDSAQASNQGNQQHDSLPG